MPDCGRKQNTQKSEGGYALLIVMLALILISMFAVTFYTTTASHHLQQQQVESTTLSVGAAEMGVQRVHYELKEIVYETWNEIKFCTNNNIAPLCSWYNEKEDIRKLNLQVRKQFLLRLNDKIDSYLSGHRRSPDWGEIEGGNFYYIDSISSPISQSDREVKISYTVIGNENGKKKNIKSDFNIFLPEEILIGHKDSANGEEVYEEMRDINKSIFNIPSNECAEISSTTLPCQWNHLGKHKKLQEILAEVDASNLKIFVPNLCLEFSKGNGNRGCNNNWDFNGATIYSNDKVEQDLKNLNNTNDGKLVFDGKIKFKKVNGTGFTKFSLVARSIDVEQKVLLGNNSSLLLLGSENKHIFDSNWGTLSITPNSKACIVTSGLTKESLFSEKLSNSGELLLYPENEQSIRIAKNKNGVAYSDYRKFIKDCGEMKDYSDPKFTEEQLEVKTEVNYS